MYCIVLYCIVVYCIVFYCISLYCIALHFIVLYCIVLYCIALHDGRPGNKLFPGLQHGLAQGVKDDSVVSVVSEGDSSGTGQVCLPEDVGPPVCGVDSVGSGEICQEPAQG